MVDVYYIVHNVKEMLLGVKYFLQFFKNFLGGGGSFLFKPEEPFFECYAAGGGKSADFAVAGDYPVAGDYQRQGVSGQGTSDGPAASGTLDLLCQFEIACRLAEFNLSAHL